jgi:hypothetical protein
VIEDAELELVDERARVDGRRRDQREGYHGTQDDSSMRQHSMRLHPHLMCQQKGPLLLHIVQAPAASALHF